MILSIPPDMSKEVLKGLRRGLPDDKSIVINKRTKVLAWLFGAEMTVSKK